MELKEKALSLYKPPFKYEHTYIFDASNHMVMNVRDFTNLQLRGWGRISYMDDAENLHDEVGKHVAKALTEYWEKYLKN